MVQGAAFVELYFVMSSLFASKAYYAFGFVALTGESHSQFLSHHLLTVRLSWRHGHHGCNSQYSVHVLHAVR